MHQVLKRNVGAFTSFMPFLAVKGQRTGVVGGLSQAGGQSFRQPGKWLVCQLWGKKTLGLNEEWKPSSAVWAVRTGCSSVVSGNSIQSLPQMVLRETLPRKTLTVRWGAMHQQGDSYILRGAEKRIAKLPDGPVPKRRICFLNATELPPENTNFLFRFIYDCKGKACWFLVLWWSVFDGEIFYKKIICHLLNCS